MKGYCMRKKTLRTPKIKVKNINRIKYSKNKVMLNDFQDFSEDKLDIVVLLEQGTDLLEIHNEGIKNAEYAVIKVYFK